MNRRLSATSGVHLLPIPPGRFARLLLALALLHLPVAAGQKSGPFAAPIMTGCVTADEPTETSGIVASRVNPGLLWIHNDGHDNRIFGVQTNGRITAVLHLLKRPSDFEDIAIGPGASNSQPHLYVGDIGDNNSSRKHVYVYRFPEPSITPADSLLDRQIDMLEVFRLTYPDGPHDAEALLVDPKAGDVLIVTKQATTSPFYLATAQTMASGHQVRLAYGGTLKRERISGGDISSDGHELLLRNGKKAWLWSRSGSESFAETLERDPIHVPVIGPPTEPNGEAIAFSFDNQGYFTISEGKHPLIFFFRRR